jgi:PAS domain S-box-containing protein
MSDYKNKIIGMEEQYQLIARGLVEAIWVIDISTMTFAYIIGTPNGLRGFTVDEIVGTSVTNHCTPSCREKIFSMLGEALENFNKGAESKTTFDAELYQKDGSITWKEVTVRFYRETDGVIRVIGVSKDINEKKKEEEAKINLIKDLEEALAEKDRLLKENKILMGLLPICSACKRIRDENGKWWMLEEYISTRTNAEFTHTICPLCRDELYPELKKRTPG